MEVIDKFLGSRKSKVEVVEQFLVFSRYWGGVEVIDLFLGSRKSTVKVVEQFLVFSR